MLDTVGLTWKCDHCSCSLITGKDNYITIVVVKGVDKMDMGEKKRLCEGCAKTQLRLRLS